MIRSRSNKLKNLRYPRPTITCELKKQDSQQQSATVMVDFLLPSPKAQISSLTNPFLRNRLNVNLLGRFRLLLLFLLHERKRENLVSPS